jgi:hypothetical protein
LYPRHAKAIPARSRPKVGLVDEQPVSRRRRPHDRRFGTDKEHANGGVGVKQCLRGGSCVGQRGGVWDELDFGIHPQLWKFVFPFDGDSVDFADIVYVQDRDSAASLDNKQVVLIQEMDVLIVEPLKRARIDESRHCFYLIRTHPSLRNVTPIQEQVFGSSAHKRKRYGQLVATDDYSHVGNRNRTSSIKVIYESGGSRMLVESPQVTDLQPHTYIAVLTAGNIIKLISYTDTVKKLPECMTRNDE